jgi:hypothetical protein
LQSTLKLKQKHKRNLNSKSTVYPKRMWKTPGPGARKPRQGAGKPPIQKPRPSFDPVAFAAVVEVLG